jgi:hypothetical protein
VLNKTPQLIDLLELRKKPHSVQILDAYFHKQSANASTEPNIIGISIRGLANDVVVWNTT